MKLATFVATNQHVLFTCFRSFQVFCESVRVLLDRRDDISARFAMEMWELAHVQRERNTHNVTRNSVTSNTDNSITDNSVTDARSI